MSTKKNKTKAINQLEYGVLLNWQNSAEYGDARTSPEDPIQIELWQYIEKSNEFKRLYKS